MILATEFLYDQAARPALRAKQVFFSFWHGQIIGGISVWCKQETDMLPCVYGTVQACVCVGL